MKEATSRIIYTLLLISGIYMTACHNNNSNDQPTTTTEANNRIVKSSNANTDATTKSLIKVVNFEELEGLIQQDNDTVYVYNFWATWCKPCIAELPYFEQIGEQYAKQKVKVTLISLDFTDMLDDRVIPFIKKRQLKSALLLLDGGNPNEWIDKISPEWSGAIPATLIIAKGKRHFYEQEFTFEELENTIKSLL